MRQPGVPGLGRVPGRRRTPQPGHSSGLHRDQRCRRQCRGVVRSRWRGPDRQRPRRIVCAAGRNGDADRARSLAVRAQHARSPRPRGWQRGIRGAGATVIGHESLLEHAGRDPATAAAGARGYGRGGGQPAHADDDRHPCTAPEWRPARCGARGGRAHRRRHRRPLERGRRRRAGRHLLERPVPLHRRRVGRFAGGHGGRDRGRAGPLQCPHGRGARSWAGVEPCGTRGVSRHARRRRAQGARGGRAGD